MDGGDVVRREPFGDNPTVGHRGATTQRSILDAALTVFAEHGFHDTRVELITEAAGCSRPAFYQYFSSKEDVFWRLAGHLLRELQSLVERLEEPTPDADGVRALERWLEELVDLYQAYQPVFVSFREAFREDQPRKPLPHTMAARFLEVIEAEAAASGTPIAKADLTAIADATVATVLRTIHYWLLGVERTPRPRFVAGLAATIHRIFFGAIDDVNVGPVVAAPPKRKPAWPARADDERPLRPRGRVTRQRLLDAGSSVLPVRGYHETRVDDIVAEAGFSHGSFYRYFENKDELFGVLAFEAVEHMTSLVGQFPDDPNQSIEPWIEDWFASYRSKGGVLSAWEEIGFGAPDVVARSAEITAVFTDRLQRLVDRRGFGDIPVDALALLAVIEHGSHGAVVRDDIGESRSVAAVGHVIERGILGRT